jgi:hypothetical protein
MNRRVNALYLGILALAVFGALGCKKLVHAKAKANDTCGLLTDAEIESAMKLKVSSHKGDADSCEWVLGSGTGLVGLMKSSKGAEAVLNGALGTGTPVAGVGDSAMWLGGMTPILVVHTKGEIYRLSVTSPPLMTPQSASTKTVVVERHQAGSGTIEKQAISFDYPELESGAVVLAKAFIGRL